MVDDLSTNRPTGKNTTEESVGKEIPSRPKVFLYQWRRPVGEFKYYHRSNRRRQQTKEQGCRSCNKPSVPARAKCQ